MSELTEEEREAYWQRRPERKHPSRQCKECARARKRVRLGEVGE